MPGVPDTAIDYENADIYPVPGSDNTTLRELGDDITIVLWPKEDPSTTNMPSPVTDALAHATFQLQRNHTAAQPFSEPMALLQRDKLGLSHRNDSRLDALIHRFDVSERNNAAKFSSLEAKNTVLEEKNTVLEEKNTILEHNMACLDRENKDLRTENRDMRRHIDDLVMEVKDTSDWITIGDEGLTIPSYHA